MGKSVPDNEYVSILLGSLPTTYAGMLGSIAASSEMSGTAISSTVVIKLAIDECDRRSLQSGKAQDEAFTADAQKKKKGKKCENCHKKGHTKDQCWAKGSSNEGGGPKRKGKDDDKKDSDKAATATTKEKEADIEAWAAIEDIESDDAALYVPAVAVEYSAKAECKIYDSGASRHMSQHRKHFVTYETIPARPITAANNKVFHAIGMGDLEVKLPNGDKSSKALLKDVLHAPDMTLTVVSIGRIMKAGYNVEFDEDEQVCWIRKKKNGPIIGRIPVGVNNLFKVEHALSASSAGSAHAVDIRTLHRRLGHVSVDAIRALIRGGSITGLQLIDDFPSFICDSCEYAKTTRKLIRKGRSEPQAQSFGDEVHTDVWGPSPTHSLGGRRYYVTFMDDCTHYTKLD